MVSRSVPSCESADSWWIPSWEPNAETRQLPQSSSKGSLFVRARLGGAPSTVEEVVRVWYRCLLT